MLCFTFTELYIINFINYLLISVKADPVKGLKASPSDNGVISGSFEKPDAASHLNFEFTLYVTSSNPSLDNRVSYISFIWIYALIQSQDLCKDIPFIVHLTIIPMLGLIGVIP